MKIKKRDIALYVILTIFTCGLFSFYWTFCMLDDMYNELEIENHAVRDVLLIPFTCGLYFIYISYKFGKMLSAIYKKYNVPSQDNSIIFTILTISSLSIITFAIVQDNLNTIAKTASSTYAITENNDN